MSILLGFTRSVEFIIALKEPYSAPSKTLYCAVLPPIWSETVNVSSLSSYSSAAV